CLFPGFELKLRVAADNLFGLCERPVGHGHFSSGKPDAGAQRCWPKPSVPDHGSAFRLLFGELANRVHQFLRRRTLLLSVLDYHHESHRYISLLVMGPVPGMGLDQWKLGSIHTSNETLLNRHRENRAAAYFLEAIFLRSRSSCSLSSGVNSSPKSAASN